MKRLLCALVSCALALGLVGCSGSSVLDRSYSSVTVHQEQAVSDEDDSILRAETYADLVSCVQHFVSLAQDTGTVHVYKYTGDIVSDLETACEEVRTEDPLGAYALSDIQFEYSRIVSYYECTFTFTYCRTPEEIDAIVAANSRVAIREQLEQALASFDDVLTLRTDSYYASPSDLYTLIQDTYYASPGTALGYPDVSVSVWPDSGNVRIVEIRFGYDQSQEELLRRAEEVAASAALLVGQETAADATVAWLLCSRLAENTSYVPAAESDVYSALCRGHADSEGISLAYQLLCELAGIPCQIVRGTLEESPHCWNLVELNGTFWMLDVTRGDAEERFLHNDDHMTAYGYSWSREDYPACDGEEIWEDSEEEDAAQRSGTPEEPLSGRLPRMEIM